MTDVIVVGAGPTGLLLAGDLAVAGRSVTLVERRPEAVGNLTRALAVHARTLEQLDARGLADELVARGYPVRELRLLTRTPIDLTRLHSRFPYVLVVGQYEVERLLERRAREAGATFLYDTEVTGVRQEDGGAGVEVRGGGADAESGAESGWGPESGSGRGSGSRVLRASYVVGTDGASSTVRRSLGLPFPGSAVIRSMVLADVRLTRTPPAPLMANAEGDFFALVGAFGDGWYRVMGWNRARQLPDSAPADLDEVREAARQALGSDYGMHSPRWISRFHSDERQAPHYRVGRVFLAGDAAHVHSPAGGMGMNTGLQDAANLSWKLSAVLDGRAGDALLDTYETERHPVGAMVLRASGVIIRLALTRSAPLRALRSAGSQLLVRAHPFADRVMRMVTGIGIAYPSPRGAHPLVGRRAPDLALSSGRLYEVLRAGRFVVVGPRGDERVRSVVPGDDGPAVYAESTRSATRTLLIRPDGYIAWAADRPDPASLRRALAEWTGQP
ncbi:FAD-dependent monooxygenase [Streptomyces scopuliridis]|uniref:FAD-dependent oxidoreductase n=1 Tax=Streptomyces scopuliridis TaxID=452529 RepID=UPI002DDA2D1F|nr:FAD-dependent oxidoreductase [Streptomyces scopuliridis]WSB35280.1 FAD-dependent monooxygenase [Streptomyces scopuliridis]